MNAENVSVSGVVKKGYSLYLKMLPILVALGIFIVIISGAIIFYEATVTEPSKAGLSIMKLVEAIVTWLIGLSLYAVLIKGYYNHPVDIGNALMTGLKKFFPSIGAMIIAGVILLIPPAIVGGVCFFMMGGFAQLAPPTQSSLENTYQMSSLTENMQHAGFKIDSHQPVIILANSDTSAAQDPYQGGSVAGSMGQPQPSLGDVAGSVNQSMVKLSTTIYLVGAALVLWVMYFAVRLSLVMPLIVNQNKGPWTAVKDSFRLTKGRFWKTFAVMFCAALPYMLVIFVIGIVFAIVFSEQHADLAVSIAVLICQLVLAPMIPATITAYLESIQPSQQ